MESPKNYYSILGLAQDATITDIKKAYRRLAFRYHPDQNRSGVHSVDRFRDIKEAYDMLSDPFRKQQYDAMVLAKQKHIYAPSYSFGKFTTSNPPPKPPKPPVDDFIHPEKPVSVTWLWLKPIVLIIISIILMRLILLWAGN